MIFLCFNIADRESVAEQILYHMSSFGFHVWYDRKDIFLGENRYQKNILEGANNIKNAYSIIILSKHFSRGDYCKKELNVIMERYQKGETFLFPILYDILPEELPKEYQWLLKLVCKIMEPGEEKLFATYHIVSKITSDLLAVSKYTNFHSYLCSHSEKCFINDLIKNYEILDMNNYSARMSLLYSLYIYIKNQHNIYELPCFYYKGFEKLFSFTRLNIGTDHREMQIMENLGLLLLSIYY